MPIINITQFKKKKKKGDTFDVCRVGSDNDTYCLTLKYNWTVIKIISNKGLEIYTNKSLTIIQISNKTSRIWIVNNLKFHG